MERKKLNAIVNTHDAVGPFHTEKKYKAALSWL